MDKVTDTIESIVQWIKSNVEESNSKGVVFGLSGGIDSAVIAALAKKAFPNDSLGLIMPCHSNELDETDARLVADSLDLKIKKVDLSKSYDMFLESMELDTNNKLAKANIKPRLRMTTLYYHAQCNNYLVIGSTNKSEFEIGYFTKHADSAVDMLPLVAYTKSQIKILAKSLEIPEEIISKKPSAGLWEDQTDESEMGFSYDTLDEYLNTAKGPDKIIQKIERMNKQSHHKRVYPPVFTKK